jgi:hypothetical protein
MTMFLPGRQLDALPGVPVSGGGQVLGNLPRDVGVPHVDYRAAGALNPPNAAVQTGLHFRRTWLFCQRQNTGRTGLVDHYRPVS